MIRLRYGNFENGVLTWADAMEFNEIEKQKIEEINATDGRDLAGRTIRNVLSVKTIYRITFGSDELVGTKFDYLWNLLRASRVQIDLNGWVEAVVRQKGLLNYDFKDYGRKNITIDFEV